LNEAERRRERVDLFGKRLVIVWLSGCYKRREKLYARCDENGGAIWEVDGSGGDYLDSGLHRNQLRLLRLLLFPQVPSQHLSDQTQLPGHRQRHGQGLRLVLRSRPQSSPALPRHLHRRLHGTPRLRPPVARPQKLHHLALLSGSLLPSLLFININLISPNPIQA